MKPGRGSGTTRVALLALVALVCSGCWTQFRGDAARTGNQPFETGIDRANVSTLSVAWDASLGLTVKASPTIGNDTVFLGSANKKLYAFDAKGVKSCTGALCGPLWTAKTGNTIDASSAAVANGAVFVTATDNRLYAFSAAGTTNCLGSPLTCTPLWTAATGNAGASSPAVADGIVYVTSGNKKLLAFDAAGTKNCSGTPVVCTPLWTATAGAGVVASPAVANGVVYVVANDGKLTTYDAKGVTGCTGTTTVTCTPLWTAVVGAAGQYTTPAVAQGRVFVGGDLPLLQAYDATGVTNCGGTPKVCTRVWSAATAGTGGSPALANGTVYLGERDGTVAAFDLAGVQGCSGSPAVCVPRWTATTNADASGSPAVANGVVYVGSTDGNLYAYDATGTMQCSGAPTVCAPLWSAPNGGTGSSPAVLNGTVYIGRRNGVSAYRPCVNPKAPVGYGPCELQNAYRLPGVYAGGNRTVGIVDANHDPNAEADMNTYRSTFGLPPCTKASGCFRQVNQLGQTSNYPPADVGWSVEISLDLQMVSATCPLCKIVLVESPNDLDAVGTAEDTAVALGADVVSNSFGTPETGDLPARLDAHFTHPGVPIVASSGDDGYAAGPQYPAVVPTVTAVGGTTLTHTGTGRGWSETVWHEGVNTAIAGSGCSAFEPKPAWQTDPGCARRTEADVAAVAQDLAVYDSFGLPGWITVGGTSASAPIVASLYALAGGTTDASEPYAHRDLLYDVTDGDNGTCGGSYLCTAGTGYDGPTGLGTPCGVGAFGPALRSPGGCGGRASQPAAPAGAARLAPSTASVPACRVAPPDGVRCLANYRP